MIDIISLALHVDTYIGTLIQQYGVWMYALLFLIIFIETGLVVTPFLPGDSLLFVAGAFAATGDFNLAALLLLLSIAAIAGDTMNYWIGHHIGKRVFSGNIRFIKKEHLERTETFYEKHGGKTIIIARFVPIIRTFAPFVAGVGTMHYKRFLSYNVIGGIVWVFAFTLAGYFFGNIPIVKENLSVVIYAIIVISLAAAVMEIMRHRGKKEEPKISL